MRFVVLLFGFAGCLFTACVGGIFFSLDWALGVLHENHVDQLDFLFNSADKDPGRTAVFLLISAGLGLIGTILGFCRCGWQGSMLLAIPIIGPAIFCPVTLVGTGLQGFTALISLFVRPLPITPDEEIDEE